MKMVSCSYMSGLHSVPVVDRIPTDYIVWNVGDIFGDDGLVAICKILVGYSIDRDSVKALRVSPDDAKILRNAAAYGIGKKADAVSASKKTGKSWVMKRKVAFAKAALPVFDRVS